MQNLSKKSTFMEKGLTLLLVLLMVVLSIFTITLPAEAENTNHCTYTLESLSRACSSTASKNTLCPLLHS